MSQSDDELHALRDVVQRFIAELERIARIDNDAERGRAFKRLLRSSSPVIPVPGATRGKPK